MKDAATRTEPVARAVVAEDALSDLAAPTASRELARLVALLRRTLYQWRAAAVVVILGLAAAAVVLALRKPTYRSETVILYREGIRASYLGPDAGDSLRNLGVRLKEILLARPRLEKIIDEFDLYPDVKARSGYVAAVDEFRKHIQFKPRASDTFSITFDGRTPEEVQAVTARLAEALVEESTRLRIEQSRAQSEFLAAERKRAEEDLRQKETELAKFLAAHPEFALDASAGLGIGTQQGASIRAAAAQRNIGDPALQALERQAPRIRTLLASPGPVPRASVPGAPPPDPALVQAKTNAESALAQARRDLADRQARFTDQHPDVVSARRRVAEAEEALRRAEEALAAPPPAASAGGSTEEAGEASGGDERARLQAQLAKIEAEIAARRKKKGKEGEPSEQSDVVTRVVQLETEWARVSRDANEARERMTAIEAKHFRAQMEASSELGGYAGQMLVIDPAFKPATPLPPGKTVILAGALGASLLMGALLALARALLDDQLYEPGDFPRSVQLLGVVPRNVPRRWWRRS